MLFVASDDNGESWTFPQKLMAYEEERGGEGGASPSGGGAEGGDESAPAAAKAFGIPKVIANKLVVLSNGAWLLPYWREPGKTCPVVRAAAPRREWVNGSAGVLYSEDQGLQWREARGRISDQGTWLIENSIAEVGTSKVLLQVFRTKTGHAYKDYSYDMGLTWSKPVKTFLPNPNSKMCILALPNGNVVAAYNHSPKRRSPLSLAVSKDGGLLWTTVLHLETDPSLQFAYPTMQLTQGKLLVIYSVMAERGGVLRSQGIKMAKIDAKKLMSY